MTVNITPGVLPAVPVLMPWEVTFYTDAEYPRRVIGVQFSTDGINWPTVAPFPTFLGDTPSWSLIDPDLGEVAGFTIGLTPQAAGSVTMYFRAIMDDLSFSIPSSAAVNAYQDFGFVRQIERGTGSTPTFTNAINTGTGEFSDGSMVVSVPLDNANRNNTTHVRVGGANGTVYTSPNQQSVSAIVKFAAGGSVDWVRWIDVTVLGTAGIASDKAGNVYVAGQATGRSATVWNELGTVLSTSPSDTFAVSNAVFKLTTTGAVAGSTRVAFNKSETTTYGGTITGIAANAGRVAAVVDCGLGSIVYGGVTEVLPARTTGTVRSVLVSFTDALAPEWMVPWTAGDIRDSSSISINDSGRTTVVTYAGGSRPAVAGIATVGELGLGVAHITVGGGVLYHQGLSSFSGSYAVTSDDFRNYVLVSTTDRTFSDGTYTMPLTTDAVVLWTMDSTTGSRLWSEQLTTQRSVDLRIAVRNNYLTSTYRDAFSGATQAFMTRHDANNGTVLWQASHTPAASTIAMDAATNARWTSSLITATPGVTTLTNSDGTTLSFATGLAAVATLSDQGFWGEVKNYALEEEVPSGYPSRPASTTWPSEQPGGATWIAEVTGVDPVNSGGTPRLEVIDPTTGQWTDITTGFNYPTRWSVSAITGPMGPGGALSSFVTVDTAASFAGSVRITMRWVVTDGASQRVSAGRTFTTLILEGPSTPYGEMPTIAEDDPAGSTGTFQFNEDPSSVGEYTWQLSTQYTPPESWQAGDPDYHVDNGSSINVVDDGKVVGTATVISQNDAAKSAQIKFSPVLHWNGTAYFDVRVSNGAWSDWGSASVTVTPVADRPGTPSFNLPDVNEGDTATFTVTWTDPDDEDSPGDSYLIDLGIPTWNGSAWVMTSDPEVTPWTGAGQLELDGAVVRILSQSTTTKTATLRVEPKFGYSGPYRLGVRVKIGSGDDRRTSLWATDTGTVDPSADAPAAIQGYMPAARVNESVTGRFTTIDPDGGSWVFEIRDPVSGWGTAAVIPNVGTLTVVDPVATDRRATVVLTQQPLGAAVPAYTFDLRVTDSTGLTSPAVTFDGVILLDEDGGIGLGSGQAGAGVWIQRVVRTQTGATVERVCPLTTVTDIAVTDSLDGPGSADVTVSAAEVVMRASDAGISMRDLLEPAAYELAVYAGPTPVFAGPIEDSTWEAGSDEVTISARGLMSYLEKRYLTTATVYTNQDIAVIIADLIMDSQAKAYGGLAITNQVGTSTTNATITFPAGTRISDAVGELLGMVGAPEVWIDGTRQLRASTRRGMSKRDRVRFTGSMITVAEWQAQSDTVYTSVTVKGDGSFVGSFTAGSAVLEKYGLVETYIEAPQLLNDAACEELAQRVVEYSVRAAESLRVTYVPAPGRPFAISDFGVGDGVTVDVWDDRLGQLLGNYRIINKTTRLVGAEYQVELDLEPLGASNQLLGSRARHNPDMVTRLSTVELLTRRR